MLPVAFPIDTQLTTIPSPPATVRFWSPSGSRTVAHVSTLPGLALVTEPELYLDHLQVAPTARDAVRAAIRVGAPLEFQAGPGDFALDHDEE
jgi:hypothetical protein